MRPARLSAAQLSDHLALVAPPVRRVVRRLRRLVLATVPEAEEGVRFHCLCYYHPDAPFGSIGGNICMIEVRGYQVALSFLQGASVPDPDHLLEGRARAKRYVLVPDVGMIEDPGLAALVRSAADRETWA